ncbi:uncharacterized protein RAG0_08064 [Rhynchosporium agropyri]|uniref:Aminoglycoside phosphotransferase domain-containing protein n=1 Tax=Rhynchosporium agropyri TaxID=914238 RepID=A0A1E1KP27_9HELO|nr:uncharacterized protein RAG0_08064 [Rhynchosporium agropyri]
MSSAVSSPSRTPDPAEDSDSNSGSVTSTIVYGYEPFDTYQDRIRKLCEAVLEPLGAAISVERMHGGGFNRIIGIHLVSNKSATCRYIIRVPRLEAAQLNRDLAPLQLLRHRSNLRIPEVVAYDVTVHNVLESPYMIQKRISGIPLFPAYPDMPHGTKCAIAKEFGKFFSELHSIKSVVAGRLTLSTVIESLMIQPFNSEESDTAVPYEAGEAAQPILATLCEALQEKTANL